MIEFKFVGYTENVIELCLQNWQEKTLFLFPNEVSAQKTRFLAQQKKGITDSLFSSMESWKNELFSSSLPVLPEEKRKVLWYLSLTDDMKRFFNLQNFRQSLPLARNFFDFWQEMNEELITKEKMRAVINESYTAENQLEMFDKWLEMHYNYRKLLEQKKVTDDIFLKNLENLDFSRFADFQKLIVVNQFYYSKMEKKLLHQFPCNKKIVLLQLPKKSFDTEDFSVISDDFWQTPQTKQFHIFEAKDSTEMMLQLAKQLSETEIQTIVDFRLKQQPYYSFLARKKFHLPVEKTLSQTNFGQFLRSVHSILKGTIQDGNETLIPLQSLIKAFLQPFFFDFFHEQEITQDEVNIFLQFYAEQSFLYVDWDGKWLSYFPQVSPVKSYFHRFFNWLKRLAEITTITDLISFLDADNSTLINQVSSSEERYSSTFYDILYETFSDFSTLNYLLQPEDWKQILGNSSSKATEILSLLLHYLGSRRIRFVYDEKSEKRKWIHLQDTRNISFESLAILNVVEGTLPASHKTPFLLSEHQREKLGLKTYDDILKRDKYYFQRAIAQSKNVYLFTMNNLDENLEPSSYIQELEWKGIVFQKHNFRISYRTLYGFLENQNNPVEIPALENDFFAVPFSELDFPNKTIQLTAYPFMQIIKDPYIFYWQHVLQLKPKLIELTKDYEAKFIGNFVHDIFSLIWQRLKDVYQGNKIHHHFSYTNQLYISDAVKHLQKIDPKFRYISPHNYADIYFENILLPFLQQSIFAFFSSLENHFKLTDKHAKIRFEEKLPAKPWLLLPNDWQLFIKAKADLLMETNQFNYIFDYKTGKFNSSDNKIYELQLAFYELFYYHLENSKDVELIQSSLYFVMERKFKLFKKKNKQEFYNELNEKLQTIFLDIFKNGYELSDKKYTYEDIDITRRDLQRRMKSCTEK